MAITAHPDDEASSFGGTLLEARARGHQTAVICLTPGDAGTHKGGAQSKAELAKLRREEFARAAKLLDLDLAVVLDYPDGALDRADFHSMVADAVRHIRRFRPHIVFTFGAEGGLTAHPDHSMAGLVATAAFHWAGRTNRFADQLTDDVKPWRAHKLYYTTSDFTIPDRQPIAQAPITTRMNVAKHVERKMAAFQAHTSQQPLFEKFSAMVRQRGEYECFHLAATRDITPATTETDIFAAVVED